MSGLRQSLAILALVGGVGAAVATAVPADNGPPKIPFTYNVKIFTQYGLVCSTGSGKHKCGYLPLPGTLITVSQHGKVLQRKTTNTKGFTTLKLPKGVSYLGYSHTPWRGHIFGKKTFSITAPVWLATGNYLTVTFCISGGC